MGVYMSKHSKYEKTLPDVSGKVFVITGTTSGTGFEAAQTVAKKHGEVLLLNRPSERSRASLEKLRKAVPDGRFVPIDCDLQDFGSVRRACQEILDKYSSIYCLCMNAGIMATPDEITKDGFDKQMQTNHLSHFLMTQQLFPLLKASAKACGDARIVTHSSIARHHTVHQALEAPYLTKQETDGMLGGDAPGSSGMMQGPEWARYSQTKLANSVFTQALHDKLQSSPDEACRNIRSLSAHPGMAATNLADHLSFGWVVRILMVPLVLTSMQNAADGSMGILRGMMDPDVEGGTLYGPKGMAGYALALPSKPHETDAKAKDLLWHASETAIGASFVV